MSENDDYLRPWASDMLRVGAVDNRGNPSGRALAKIAGASNATVSRMLQGITDPTPDTVKKIATALELDPTTVWERLGVSRQHVEDYTPPAESSLLTQRERRLVTEMIRVLVEGRNAEAPDQPHAVEPIEPVEDPAVADGPTRPRLSAVPGTLSHAEREELYRDVDKIDLDAEPYAAARPEDTSDDGEPL